MIDELYRETSIELHLEDLKMKTPNIKDSMLEFARLNFELGFNVGSTNFEDREVKETLLKRLSGEY